MAVIDELMKLIDAFDSFGIPLPSWLIVIILILLLVAIIIKPLEMIINCGKNEKLC